MFLAKGPVAPVTRVHDLAIPRKEIFNLLVIPSEPREIVELVNDLISEQHQTLSSEEIFNLGRIHRTIEFECKKIEADTRGIWAFFESIFRSGAQTERKSNVTCMQNSRLFIEEVLKAMPGLEKEGEEESFKPIENDQKGAGGSQLVETNQSPPTQLEDVSIPPPPDAPPAPPSAPPPPLLPANNNKSTASTAGVKSKAAQEEAPQAKPLSEEEKHLLTEQKKLERWFSDRANPDIFFFKQAPKNERELTKKRDELNFDIERIKETDHKDKETWLQKKETALADIADQLKPQKMLLQYANQQQRALFNEKVAKYTNVELFIIVAIFFDGKAPEASHPSYSIYSFNQELLTQIFNDWKQLAAGERERSS